MSQEQMTDAEIAELAEWHIRRCAPGPSKTAAALRQLLAERDAAYGAIADMPNPVSVAQTFWEKRHADVISRAMAGRG